MPKFTSRERQIIDGIVASLSIKRIPESEILNEVKTQIGKSITKQTLYNARNRIKKESLKLYCQLKQGRYEYLHEFKQRIREIEDLIKRHYEIVEDNTNSPSIKQTSLAEFHKLNVTLSKYFDILPSLISSSNHNNNSNQNQKSMQGFEVEKDDIYTRWEKEDKCICRKDGSSIFRHNKCASCYAEWCPKAARQDWCPNPQCHSGVMGSEYDVYDSLGKWIQCSCKRWFKTQEILQAHLAAYRHAHVQEKEQPS